MNKYIFAYLPVVLSGIGVSTLFIKFNKFDLAGILFIILLSFFIGVSLASTLLLFLFYFKIPFIYTQITLYLIGLSGLVLGYYLKDKSPFLSIFEIGSKKLNSIQILLGIVCIGICYYFLNYAFTTNDTMFTVMPNGYFDAFATWNFKSRLIFLKPFEFDVIFHLPTEKLHLHDYPFLCYYFNAYIFHSIGKINYEVPFINSMLYTYGSMILLFVTISYVKNMITAAILLAMMLFENLFLILMGNSQYADTPLAAYFIVTICVFLFSENMEVKSKKGILILLGFIAASTSLIKNEGTLFLFVFSVFFAAYMLIVAKSTDEKKNNILFYGLGTVLPFIVLRLFRIINLCKNEMMKDFTFEKLVINLTNSERYNIIFTSISALVKFHFLEMILTLIVLIVIIGVSYKRKIYFQAGMIFLTAFSICGGYFLIYLFTPFDLTWHINTSADRLLIHVASLFKISLIILLPEKYKLSKNLEY